MRVLLILQIICVDTKTEQPAATHYRRLEFVIMNRLHPQIAITLALLAVVALPVEQMLSANCCCRSGQQALEHSERLSARGCCAAEHRACCSRASELSSARDVSERQAGDSQPCSCPCRCGELMAAAVDSVLSVSVKSDESTASGGFFLLVAAPADAEPDSAGRPARYAPSSGAHRCILLCRYRL